MGGYHIFHRQNDIPSFGFDDLLLLPFLLLALIWMEYLPMHPSPGGGSPKTRLFVENPDETSVRSEPAPNGAAKPHGNRFLCDKSTLLPNRKHHVHEMKRRANDSTL
jgi:hypothetical protein